MPALSIQPTYPIFTGTDGQPLESGYIWIGASNLNPLTNPISVYWNAALTQPAAQPIRTIGGYPVNAGTPARLYVNSDYSIQVQNRNGSVVYSAPAATERYSGEVIEITFNDVTGQLGSDRVNFLQAGTGAVTRTAQSKMRDVVSVKDFGAVGDGVTDDTAAIQAAINAVGNAGELFWPKGTYKVTSTLVQNYNRQRWTGVGRGASLIYFAPTAADTCVEFGTTAGLKVLGSIADIGFYSDDSTYKKIAIDLIDVDIFTVDRVTIQGGFAVGGTMMWSGATSVGVRIRGRDHITFNDLYIAADQPIQFSDNPSNSIDIDNGLFRDLYLIANNNPCVLMDSGINITQVTFAGRQSWNKGTSGFKWADTGTSLVGNGLVFENVRTEQGTDAAAYSFDIAHNYGLQNLAFRNCYFDPTRKGIKLRNCADVLLEQTYYVGTGEVYNVDSTVKRVTFDRVFWQAGATAVVSGQRVLWSSPLNPNTAPLPSSAFYDESANALKTVTADVAAAQTKFTLANLATASLGSDLRGTLTVVTSEGFGATYMLHGTQGLVDVGWRVGSTADSFFSNAAATASKVNVYYTGGQYTIENRRGLSIDVRIALAGTYGSL